jgi:ribonuclease BN (tRNA processing enzyme)
MQTKIYIWGSGASFGRELGLSSYKNRQQRNHTAISIINNDCHFLIDAGATCVEKMVDQGVKVPDILFITHPHYDHISDLDKLAYNRKRSTIYLQNAGNNKDIDRTYTPLPVIGTEDCLNHPEFGLKRKCGFLTSLNWFEIPCFDEWYSIHKTDNTLFVKSNETRSNESSVFPIEFKALPVNHSPHGPGACLYIFRYRDNLEKKIVISGDFETIEENVIENPDLRDPSYLFLETNTIYATSTHHTNWQQNKELINKWFKGDKKSHVILMISPMIINGKK